MENDHSLQYNESIIDEEQNKEERNGLVGKEKEQTSLTLWEFNDLVEACKKSEEFQKAIAEFQLPEGFELVVEPWSVTSSTFRTLHVN